MKRKPARRVSRSGAIALLHLDPNSRARNYELEEALEDRRLFGVRRWVIAEWCPYNGVFCAWRDHAPASELQKTIDEMQRRKDEGKAPPHLNDYIIGYLRESLEKGS